ncbi:MAG TPA: hypothetical protein VHL60_00475 [Oxalicibacterium sp.]|jgi:hypothetical protein|nr:hypothetical protein [Oxalicibacterium sp.]
MVPWRQLAAAAFITGSFAGADASAVEFTYSSNELKWRSGSFNELNDYGQAAPPPRFSFSFDVPGSWLSPDSPSTFHIPVQSVTTDPAFFETIDINLGAGGTLTVNPDGSVASWIFSMLLTELPVPRDPIYDVFDRRVLISSVYGAGTCNCDTFELKNTLFTYNGEYFEPLGFAQAVYRSRSRPIGWIPGAVSPVPEPSSAAMLTGGLLLLALHGLRRRLREQGRRLFATAIPFLSLSLTQIKEPPCARCGISL